MNKKQTSILFTIGATIYSVFLTLAIICVLVVTGALFVKLIHASDNAIVVLFIMMIGFLGGMILSMWLYAKTVTWFIHKFHLEDKLDSRLFGRKKGSSNEEPKKKTVMPNSVLPKESDEDTWAEEIENSNFSYPTSFGREQLGEETKSE